MGALVHSRSEKRAARRAGDGGKRTEYLAFRLAGETYAIQIADLAEIIRPPPITEVPRAPRAVLGLVSVRGKLVTVIDLRRRLNVGGGRADGASPAVDPRARILIADVGSGEQFGLFVDEVQEVWRLAAEQIESPDALGVGEPGHIAGLGRPAGVDGPFLILLDLRPLLAAP
jgi:purine-binding chemotaxis protein CheW